VSVHPRLAVAATVFVFALLFVMAQESVAEGEIPVEVEVSAAGVTVGDPIDVTLSVTLPEGTRLDPPEIGPALGSFSVVDGSWFGPEESAEGDRWSWRGAVASFRAGEQELPSVRISVETADGETLSGASEARTIEIGSVLEPEEADSPEAEIADLKGPASVAPDYRALWRAAAILAVLVLVAGLLWWLHRRYAARLAAVPSPDDPFQRTPPHEWVYAELQRLLEQRLAEQGQVVRFFAELSWILKRYLGGRYRVELMERTTAEVPPRLRQAGAHDEAIEAAAGLLDRCDMVKFAKDVPGSEACRDAIEEAYRIVDSTKPRPAPAEAGAA
jgi:hypothetical protein